MKSKNIKKGLLSLLVLGAASGAAVGTFASFNAQTTNLDNALNTGTLVLSDTVGAAAACLSTNGGTTDVNVNDCSTIFTLSVAKPGDSQTGNLTLKNEGSIAATAFKVFTPGCTDGDAPGESFHGTGLACSKVQFYVQEFADAAFTTPTACVYGAASGATCQFGDATKTLAAFASSYGSDASALPLSGGLGAGASRYFQLGVKLPLDADNTFQGRSASLGFSWFIEQ